MINLSKKRIPLLELMIPLTCILSQYYLGGSSIPFGIPVCFVLLCLHIFFNNESRVYVYRPLLFFVGFMLVHDCLRIMVAPLALGQMSVYTLIALIIICSTNNIDEEKLYKVWAILGMIVMLGILYQSVQVYILRIPVKMINLLPFLTTSTEKSTAISLRPCSIFLEPALYCTWITPLLYLALKRKRTAFAIAISLSLLLSTSAIGMLMLFVCWGHAMIFQSGGMKKGIRFIGVSFIVVAFAYALLNLGIFSSSLGRLYQLRNEMIYGGGSSYRRLIAGYKIYGELPTMSKLFGIPYQTLQQMLLAGDIDYRKYYISTTAMDFGYVNTISRCMIMYGVIGLVIMIWFVYRVWKDMGKEYKELLFLIVISLFTQSTLFNSIFLLQFSTLLGLSRMKNCRCLVFRRK